MAYLNLEILKVKILLLFCPYVHESLLQDLKAYVESRANILHIHISLKSVVVISSA
jgi:hypothetical protein